MNKVKFFHSGSEYKMELDINEFARRGNLIVSVSLTVSKHGYNDFYTACVVYK